MSPGWTLFFFCIYAAIKIFLAKNELPYFPMSNNVLSAWLPNQGFCLGSKHFSL